MPNNSRSECLKIYFKLKQQESIIEKSVETSIESSKVYPEQWRDLIHDLDRFESEYKKLSDNFRKRIIDIYEDLRTVKLMTHEENVKTIDLNSFKDKLQHLWKRIQEFKDSCKKTEKLIEEQSNLENDLNATIKLIEKHKNFSFDDNFYCRKSNLLTQSHKFKSTKELDYEEVEDFGTLVSKTGHTGSWSQEDHLLYVKLRKKHHKSLAALVRAISSKCPDLSKESIVNHDAWYRTYLRLRDRQKAKVQEWREQRKRAKLDRIAPVDDVLDVPVKSQDEDQPKKFEDDQKKEMLRLWRERRESLKAAEEERLKSIAKAKLEDKENRRKKRDAEIKKLLAEHRENKIAREEQVAKDTTKSLSSSSSFILKLNKERDHQELANKRKLSFISRPSIQRKTVQSNLVKSHESLFQDPKTWEEKPKYDQTISLMRDYSRRTEVSWKNFYELPDPIFY